MVAPSVADPERAEILATFMVGCSGWQESVTMPTAPSLRQETTVACM